MPFYTISTRSALIYGGSISVLSTIGIAGNLLVLVAVLGSAQMRSSPTNLFLVNLALADSLFLIAHSVAWVPRFVFGTAAWMPPWALCPVTDHMLHTALYASIFTYIAISVERYIAIVYPMRRIREARQGISDRHYDGNHRRVFAICAAIWALAALWWAPNAYATRVQAAPMGGPNGTVVIVPTCALRYQLLFASVEMFAIYNWGIRLAVFALYVLAVLSSVLIYMRICRVLWARDNLIHGKSGAAGSKLKSRRGVVKMLIICAIIFLFCYTCMMIITAAQMLHVERPAYISLAVSKFVPAALNILMSSSNPYVYTLFSANFRKRFAQILPCCGTIGRTAKRVGHTIRQATSTMGWSARLGVSPEPSPPAEEASRGFSNKKRGAPDGPLRKLTTETRA